MLKISFSKFFFSITNNLNKAAAVKIAQPNQTNQQNQPNYSNLVDQVIEGTITNEDLKKSVITIRSEIKRIISEAYNYHIIDEVLRKVKTEHLCKAAVEQYVGSMTSPKNDDIKDKFLTYAQLNSKTEEESLMVDYYDLYLKKLDAVSMGKEKDFQDINEKLLSLAQKGNVNARHLMAKEMYKVSLNMLGSKMKKQKELMSQEALTIFRQCVDEEFPHSFYYIGEMAESGDMPGGINLSFAIECYTIAASFDNPGAFFKLGKFYKQDGVVKKDPRLEYIYTKKAAELGLIDAMHNLGVMYQEGVIVEKDEMKALAWFNHAGQLGFSPSMYNAAMIFYRGTSDGFLTPNKKAALILLDKVQKQQKGGEIDVQKEINRITKELEMEQD